MRAVYLKDLYKKNLEEEIVVTDQRHHHLANVVRLKINEQILALFGGGVIAKAEVKNITKKKTVLKIGEIEKKEDKRQIHLIVGIIKREALENIVRMSVESGIKKVSFVQSEHSQKLMIKEQRLETIIQNAMEQSNNPFGLESEHILNPIEFNQLEESIKTSSLSYLLSLKPFEKKVGLSSGTKIKKDKELITLCVGPEGGWSEREELDLINWGCRPIRLSEFILRAPTAVAQGLGFVQGVLHRN